MNETRIFVHHFERDKPILLEFFDKSGISNINIFKLVVCGLRKNKIRGLYSVRVPNIQAKIKDCLCNF